MTAYIAVSFSNRQQLNDEITTIKNALQDAGIQTLVFVDDYLFEAAAETKMMQQAMECIDRCDFFIALLTYKAIGVGVEAGYAKAKNKPVIYARHIAAAHSTTVSGISNFHIFYRDTEDLRQQLTAAVQQLQ